MTINLGEELTQFKEEIKKDKTVEIAHRPGLSGGGGSMTLITMLLLFSILIKLFLKNYSKLHYSNYIKQYWTYSPDPRFT